MPKASSLLHVAAEKAWTNKALFLSLALGVGLIVAVAWMARPVAILARMGALGATGIAALLLNFGLGFSCGVEGWRALLRAHGVRSSFSSAFGIMSGGYALGYLIPSCYLAGEPVRVLLASRRFSAQGHEIMATIVLEKVLFAATVAALLVGAGVVGLRSGLPPVLHQGVLSFAGAAVLMVGATLVGVTRRTPWASSCLALVRRFLPRWAFLEWGNRTLFKIEGDLRKALSGRRGAVANAAGFITLSVWLNALAPFIFFAFAYGRILSLEELALFFTLSTMFSLFSWLTPGAVGIAEGAYAGIFGIMGLPIDGALAFALVQRVASLSIVVLGLLYLGRQGVDGFGKGKIEHGGAEPNLR